MPMYNYVCLDCEKQFKKKHKREPQSHEEMIQVLYATKHAMDPTPEDLKAALICPRCNGGNAQKTFYGSKITCYTRGTGWKDKSGIRRDMDMHKIVNDQDPYAAHRVPGETEHLKRKLKNMGRRNPRARYYTDTRKKKK